MRTICINSFNSFKGIVTFTSIYKYMLKFWPCNFEPARCIHCPRIWAFGTSNINNKLIPALARPSTVRGPASTHEALKRIEPLTTNQQNPYKPQDGFSNVDWSIKRKSKKNAFEIKLKATIRAVVSMQLLGIRATIFIWKHICVFATTFGGAVNCISFEKILWVSHLWI